MNRIALAMTAALAALLAACGGGSGGDDGSGTPALAAECTASKAMQYGSTGGVFEVASGTLVVEMQNVAQAAADGMHTVQATSLSPGDASLSVYSLEDGRCTRSVAEASLAQGTPTRDESPLSSAQERLFLVLKSSSRVLVQMCAYKGTQARACDPQQALVAGVVTDADGHPIAGVNVDVSNDGKTTTVVTDDHGQFMAPTPSGTLPDSYVVDVYDGEHVPVAAPVTQSPDGVDTLGVTLTPVSDTRAPLEINPVVHHLGDGLFSGQENSQLQFPDAEGLSRDYTFTLTAAQLAHPTASFDLTAKAVDCADEITINGQLVGTLTLTPADGSYGAVQVAVPVAALHPGVNTATLAAVMCETGDYDDFEYSVPVIGFE
jgi:hypothetical protein